MVTENNVTAITEIISKLGLPESLTNELRLHLCFLPDQFYLLHYQERGRDRLRFDVCVQKEKGANAYVIPFYEACLQKTVVVPVFQVGAVNSAELEKRMSAIDWQGINKKLERVDLKAIEEIVFELNQLITEPEGQQVADLLRWKYWASTPFFIYCNNNRGLKNDFEVVQRFYLFQNEEIISIDEAYRFLCHRWREKQFHGMKKQQDKSIGPKPAKADKKKTSRSSSTKKGTHVKAERTKH
jgi:hypothetical protein